MNYNDFDPTPEPPPAWYDWVLFGLGVALLFGTAVWGIMLLFQEEARRAAHIWG